MRFHAFACEVLAQECLRAGKLSKHIVDIDFLPFGSHDRPDELRENLQRVIDGASGTCDYILLAFGLCGGATAGLFARETPVVIPRAHECITILLGSKDLYLREFGANPGTYYTFNGLLDRRPAEGGRNDMHLMPPSAAEDRYQEYVRSYGEENATYLSEEQSSSLAKYNRTAFINTGLGDVEYYRGLTQNAAQSRGWSYAEIPGDLSLIDALFAGDWDPEKYLIVEPGQKTVMDYNSHIIRAA